MFELDERDDTFKARSQTAESHACDGCGKSFGGVNRLIGWYCEECYDAKRAASKREPATEDSFVECLRRLEWLVESVKRLKALEGGLKRGVEDAAEAFRADHVAEHEEFEDEMTVLKGRMNKLERRLELDLGDPPVCISHWGHKWEARYQSENDAAATRTNYLGDICVRCGAERKGLVKDDGE